ncbi:MAG: FtsX-like permease family protein, partial [Gammaproteobacteria bacterium]|nr:FtsX-like permease family protein [Gammaproteobacteria bacterium]
VAVFVDRIERGVTRNASELLAADLVLQSSQPIGEPLEQLAHTVGLRVAHSVTFRSVGMAGERYQLSQVKAVSNAYPLRGELLIASEPGAAEQVATHGPASGEAWLEARLLQALQVRVGDNIELGKASLRVGAVLVLEPDRGAEPFNLAPRILFNLADLPGTGLVQLGSRVRYRMMLTGDPDGLARFSREATPLLAADQRLQSVEESQPQVSSALDRARRFLGLAALTSVLLSGIAIAICARRHAERHLDSAALLRALGARQIHVALLFMVQLCSVGALAITAGIGVGYLAQSLLASLLEPLMQLQLPSASAAPASLALGVGLITLLGFSLAPILALAGVPPMRVLRRQQGRAPGRSLHAYLLAAAAALLLLAWQAGDVVLFGYVTGGMGAAMALMSLSGLLLLRLLGPLRHLGRGLGAGAGMLGWRYGVACIVRRGRGSVLQMVAFGIGLALMLMLTLVRTSLIQDWRDSLPANAPNHFLMNIQPSERDALADFLVSIGVDKPRLYPLTPARLIEHNGRKVRPSDYESARASRLAARDFSLSSNALPKPYNRIVAGHWWSEDPASAGELSVESGIAETLGLALGDELVFLAAGRELRGLIVNLREVDWNGFGVNFFIEARPELMADVPATYITSVHVPDSARPQLQALLERFPSVTLVDVDAVLGKVREIMDQAARGIEFVLVFTLLAGLLVLVAGLQATLDERRHEAAVLLSLGASRRAIGAALGSEFALLGAMSGLLAAATALGLGALLAEQLLGLDYTVQWLALPIGMVCGAVGFTVFGLAGTHAVLRTPPMRVLRDS